MAKEGYTGWSGEVGDRSGGRDTTEEPGGRRHDGKQLQCKYMYTLVHFVEDKADNNNRWIKERDIRLCLK